jgi:hypothetical protein
MLVILLGLFTDPEHLASSEKLLSSAPVQNLAGTSDYNLRPYEYLKPLDH